MWAQALEAALDYDREKKTERIWLKVGPTLKAHLQESADADRRDLAEWVRLKLEREAKRGRKD